MIDLRRCNSENADFKNLIRFLDSELDDRYGVLQKQYDGYNKIELLETAVIAYDESIPVGCGCFKKADDSTVEMKRVFVQSDFRGKGIASILLAELEKWAKEQKFVYSILETGIKQYEAINLYNKLGYEIIENFGQYMGNTNSVCMRKKI
jgi:Acetyltransferases